MNNLETLRELFGWCTIINVAILLLSTLLIIALRSKVSSLHGSLFALDEKDLSRAYFQYLAQFKIAVIMLNIVPYVALRIMV